MKIWISLCLLAAVALVGAPLVANEETMDESVTLSGKIMCAKCTLELEGFDECQDVLVVANEEGEDDLYFLAKNEVSGEAGHTCKGEKPATVTGTLSEEDGKTWITASKIEPVEG